MDLLAGTPPEGDGTLVPVNPNELPEEVDPFDTDFAADVLPNKGDPFDTSHVKVRLIVTGWAFLVHHHKLVNSCKTDLSTFVLNLAFLAKIIKAQHL